MVLGSPSASRLSSPSISKLSYYSFFKFSLVGAWSCSCPVNSDGLLLKGLINFLPDSIRCWYKVPEIFSCINKLIYFPNGTNIADYLEKNVPVAMFG